MTSSRHKFRSVRVARGKLSRVLLALVAIAFVSVPLQAQVEPLGHPAVEERISTLEMDPSDGLRFVVFGDQKNLWNDEFPRLLEQVRVKMSAGDLLFMLDAGDIVDNGSRADQFDELRRHPRTRG